MSFLRSHQNTSVAAGEYFRAFIHYEKPETGK
jgi:hypothetical protein